MMLIGAMLLLSGCSGCSKEQKAAPPDQTRIFGTITVDEALDDSRDYSGIGVLVLDVTAGPDTLFRSETDMQGDFDGVANFPGQGAYELQIHRNNRRVADTTLILAHRDTVRIQGVLPRFSGHARISSRESEAMRTLNRLERQYNRILQIAAAGGIAQDTIPHVLDNWSNIFWQVYENWPETVAARIAARESLRMLEDRNDEMLMMRLRQHGDDEDIRMMAARFGFLSELRRNGLDVAIAWLDSLETQSTSQETRLQIAKNRIEVLYDSSRIEDARLRVRNYEADFGDDEEAMQWLSIIRYDIEHLSPGQLLPPFHLEAFWLDDAGYEEAGASNMDASVSEASEANVRDADAREANIGDEGVSSVDAGNANGMNANGMNANGMNANGMNAETLTLENLLGSPAVIEVVALSDRHYQSSYPQMQTLHILFGQEGVQFLTIPAEKNPIAVRAFYNERGQGWPVASAGAYAESDLEEQWNVYEMPVRFLIDSEGRIIRKFHGYNINELLIEIYRILNNGEIS